MNPQSVIAQATGWAWVHRMTNAFVIYAFTIAILFVCAAPVFSQESDLRAVLASLQAINGRLDKLEARIEAVACKCDKSVAPQVARAAISAPVYVQQPTVTYHEIQGYTAGEASPGRRRLFGRLRGGGCSGGG